MLRRTDSADAPVDGRNEPVPAALAQVGKADGDDEKGFEPFPKRDDECLEHASVLENEIESQILLGKRDGGRG